MSKKRAYSLMEIKSVDEEKREIRGIASTITPDRMGDIVEPKGAKYQLPIPLLWQHKHEKPIGNVTEATVTDKGIEIVATIAKGVSEEIDNAWAMIKSGLVRGLSIGFKPIEYSFLDDGGVKFSAWEWYELSAVTVPANAEANIQLIKSIAESEGVSSDTNPIASNHKKNAASGTNKPVTLNFTKDKHMKIEELLKMFAEKKSVAIKESNDIMTKASEEGRTLDAEEAERHDELTAEIKSIDEHLVRLESQKTLQIQTAEPVDTTKSFSNTTTRSHVVVTEKRAEKGLALAQVVKGIGRAQGNYFGRFSLLSLKKASLIHVLSAC